MPRKYTPEQLARKRARTHEHYLENRESTRAYHRARYQAKKELLTAQSNAWKAANRDKVNAIARKSYHKRKAEGKLPKEDKQQYFRDYYAKNTEKLQGYQQRYRSEHVEEIRAMNQAWHKTNPDKSSAGVVRRRARKSNAPISDLTDIQRRLILDAALGVCAYCRYSTPDCHLCAKGKHVLTLDHIIPLKHGGAHTLSNMVAACRSCNSKKNAGPLPGPVQPLLL